MHTTSMQRFYATAASVAGALIGLLFVAVTVAHDRPSEDPRSTHQLPAAAALTAFTNTLRVSLFGLIEHGGVAMPAGGPQTIHRRAGVPGDAGMLHELFGEVRVFLTEDERVMVYQATERKLDEIDDPREQLSKYMKPEAYLAVMDALGLEAVLDIGKRG
jgi:hypothetical protein